MELGYQTVVIHLCIRHQFGKKHMVILTLEDCCSLFSAHINLQYQDKKQFREIQDTLEDET
jgi:hypothetical protein